QPGAHRDARELDDALAIELLVHPDAMGLDGLRADAEALGDLARRLAGREETQHLELARRQRLDGPGRSLAAALHPPERGVGELGGGRRAARRSLADPGEELVDARRLRQVAAGARAEGLGDAIMVGVARQHDQLGRRYARSERGQELRAVPVRKRE